MMHMIQGERESLWSQLKETLGCAMNYGLHVNQEGLMAINNTDIIYLRKIAM